MSDLTDPRFSRIAFDPKFKPVQHEQRKVKIDKRFSAMFTDEAFKASTTKDKRGRPFANRQAEGLERFYELDEEEEEEQAEESEKADYSLKNKVMKESESLSGTDSEAEDETESTDKSESSDDQDDNDDEEKDEVTVNDLDKDWDELDKNAPTIDDATNRIAICNLDWQRVKASDLFVMMSSFLPQNADHRKKNTTVTRRGDITSVEIFPSQFGLERMRAEQLQGPLIPASRTAERNAVNDDNDQTVKAKSGNANVGSRKKQRQTDEPEDDGYKRKPKKAREESESAGLNRLRKYEIERLRYYFAIVEFDSVNTAQYVYENCDGCEFESSGMRLDLRFVPDDVQFDDERRERDAALSANQDDLIWRVATQCSSMPADQSHFEHLSDAKYFTFSALQQTNKVDLGWDRTNVDRQRTILRANTISKNELEKMDLKAYLGCSDSESNSDADASEDEDAEVGYEAKVAEVESDMESEVASAAEEEHSTKSKKKSKLSEIEKYRALIREIEDNGGRRKQKKNAHASDSENEDSESDEDCYNMEVSWEGPFDDGSKKGKAGSRTANNKRAKESEDTIGKRSGKGKRKEVEETKKRKRRTDDDMAEVDTVQRDRDAAELSLFVGRDAAAARHEAKSKFTFNVRDDRFAAMYSEPDFNVDPSANELRQAFGAKRNAAQYLSTIANEKAKRRKRV